MNTEHEFSVALSIYGIFSDFLRKKAAFGDNRDVTFRLFIAEPYFNVLSTDFSGWQSGKLKSHFVL